MVKREQGYNSIVPRMLQASRAGLGLLHKEAGLRDFGKSVGRRLRSLGQLGSAVKQYVWDDFDAINYVRETFDDKTLDKIAAAMDMPYADIELLNKEALDGLQKLIEL